VRELENEIAELEARFPGLSADFAVAERIVKQDPFRGPVISSSSSAQKAGNASLRKMQVHSKAAQRGKNKGFRLVYHVHREAMLFHVFLLHIYFKGDKEDLISSEYARLQAVLVRLKIA